MKFSIRTIGLGVLTVALIFGYFVSPARNELLGIGIVVAFMAANLSLQSDNDHFETDFNILVCIAIAGTFFVLWCTH